MTWAWRPPTGCSPGRTAPPVASGRWRRRPSGRSSMPSWPAMSVSADGRVASMRWRRCGAPPRSRRRSRTASGSSGRHTGIAAPRGWVRALVIARRGAIEPALELAREARDLLADTDSPVALADALVALSEVEGIAGNRDDAVATARRALELYERKGDAVSAGDAKNLIERFSATRSGAVLSGG